jgi:hypothetical protein
VSQLGQLPIISETAGAAAAAVRSELAGAAADHKVSQLEKILIIYETAFCRLFVGQLVILSQLEQLLFNLLRTTTVKLRRNRMFKRVSLLKYEAAAGQLELLMVTLLQTTAVQSCIEKNVQKTRLLIYEAAVSHVIKLLVNPFQTTAALSCTG